ncbi:site-2 protease family protein [Streptomyces sp. NPDC006184]|uniref:site-2 protease family protein n=1 Tax=Streptomyces sp. NPDC006184 TaxID=3155455 RepID=UPI0033A836AF
MDVSGGSGQPRSGNDGPADNSADPTAEPTDHPADRTHDTPDAPRPTTPHPATRPDDSHPADEDDTAAGGGTADAAGEASASSGDAAAPTPGTADADQPIRPPDTDNASRAAADPGPADRVSGPRPADTVRAPRTEDMGSSPADTDNASRAAATDSDAGPADRVSGPRAAATGSAPRPADPVGAPGAEGTGSSPRPADTGSARHPAGESVPHAGDSSEHRSLAHSGIAKGEPPRPRPKEPGGGILMGRPFGVPVYVAPSWFLVAALITWVFGGQLDRVLPELGAARYLVSLFFAVAFYASVLVHELAHTVAAIRFELPVRRIQLQFFGGVSEIEKEAETPGREFVLAFVGPLLSLVLAGLFYLAMKPVEPGTVPGVLLAGLMVSNLIVAIFNLLPGLPLDGGRMLRAVVWKLTGRPMSGTVAAAWVGRALAVSVLIGLPLLNHSGALGGGGEETSGMDTVTDALLAAILAAIIWTGAGNSLRMARLREHLPELRARTLTRRAVPVENDTPLSEALRRANAAGARALVVVDAEGTPLALVREAAIVGVPEHRRPWVAVSGLAQELTDGMRVSAELAGEDLLDALRAAPATEYLVVEQTGEIYGVLSAADVERAFVKAMARPAP